MQRPAKEYSEKGKTVGLCLRFTKSLYDTDSLVVMDSGFCVLKAIIELRKTGIFSSALIKKSDTGQGTWTGLKSISILKLNKLERLIRGKEK